MNHFRRIATPALVAAALFSSLNARAADAATAAATDKPAATAAAPVKIDIVPPSQAVLDKYFSNWPEGTDPKVIGKLVAENFVGRQFRFQTGTYATARAPSPVIYPEVIAWYGAFTFAVADKDTALRDQLINKFGLFSTPEGAAHISNTASVDMHVFGAVPLEIYMLTKAKGYLDLGLSFADNQWANPSADGLSSDSRFWVDDLYMLPLVELQAYRATQDKKYLERTALTFSVYLDDLQQPNGLFFHGDGADYYWCRGNGWVAAGITELLRDLPTDDPLFPKIFAGYKKMMAGLLKYQGEDGMWKQLIDNTDPANWSESSGSAMFAFAFVTGVKNGWLDPEVYGPAARKAWLGLVKKIDKDGNISDVCGGTNKWTPAQGDGVQYYLSRPRDNTPAQLQSSDVLHGNAPVLWTATALVR